ncbi:BglII/BstYI family type II restriction endonuclease [Actibacterium sp. D379-3]
MFDALRQAGFDVMVRNHAEAILGVDFPAETAELVQALLDFSISPAELIGSGGGEAASTRRLRRRLSNSGWLKHNFVVETKIDGVTKEATSHEIDHVRRAAAGTIALEIEWNNKDPFFDRDLENFQRLHAQSVISVGVVVTRGARLQDELLPLVTGFIAEHGIDDEAGLVPFGMKDRTARQRAAVERSMQRGMSFAEAFARQFVQDKFGMATTHWAKLNDRIARGVGNPCPLLLIGLPVSAVADYSAASDEL